MFVSCSLWTLPWHKLRGSTFSWFEESSVTRNMTLFLTTLLEFRSFVYFITRFLVIDRKVICRVLLDAVFIICHRRIKRQGRQIDCQIKSFNFSIIRLLSLLFWLTGRREDDAAWEDGKYFAGRIYSAMFPESSLSSAQDKIEPPNGKGILSRSFIGYRLWLRQNAANRKLVLKMRMDCSMQNELLFWCGKPGEENRRVQN